MEKNETVKFKSQVCTTKDQSQRLLDLGLKPETADMNWTIADDDREGNEYSVEYMSIGRGKYQLLHPNWYIPAWSLHRLLEMLPIDLKPRDNWYSRITDGVVILYISFDSGAEVLKSFDDNSNLYDNIIDCIKWLIKEKYFNKEYLIERQNEN